ncbi:MAG: DMT family transporter [Betaproteobacteria bacterium]|nr:MAG: DMT family transporter [Betaproteobacteria bacterium]
MFAMHPAPTPATDPMSRRDALVSLHVAALLFGFAGLFGKWLVLPPTAIVLGRTLAAAVSLWALLWVSGELRGRFEWRLAAGGAVLALHWITFFQAIQTSSVAIGLLGFASFPVFVLLLEASMLKRALSLGDWMLSLVVACGLSLTAPELRLDDHIVRGLLWGVLSGFTFALLAVGNRQLATRRAAGEIALWQNACAAACLLPGFVLAPVIPDARELGLLLVLGVVCTALAHTLFIRSMRVIPARVASVVVALEPVYGILLAVVLLREVPTGRTLAGAALIVGAALIATTRAGKA